MSWKKKKWVLLFVGRLCVQGLCYAPQILHSRNMTRSILFHFCVHWKKKVLALLSVGLLCPRGLMTHLRPCLDMSFTCFTSYFFHLHSSASSPFYVAWKKLYHWHLHHEIIYFLLFFSSTCITLPTALYFLTNVAWNFFLMIIYILDHFPSFLFHFSCLFIFFILLISYFVHFTYCLFFISLLFHFTYFSFHFFLSFHLFHFFFISHYLFPLFFFSFHIFYFFNFTCPFNVFNFTFLFFHFTYLFAFPFAFSEKNAYLYCVVWCIILFIFLFFLLPLHL